MPNIFKPSANSIASASLLGVATVPLALGLGIAALSRSPANTKVNVPINQPIPFSHQHHAYELGIDCRYCHTSVEKSSYAGLPSTETCMSCHSQIWTNSPLLEPLRQSYETGKPIKWTVVNKVPQFVHFNHSIHVARGVNCNTCHGPVNDMHITWKGNSFQMKWCLQCHRAPERYIYKSPETPNHSPRQQVFDLYWKLQEKGKAGLNYRDQIVAVGKSSPVNRSPEDIKEGRKLINEYGVKVQQLADCSVCHY
ncbi:MAG: cytochrome c3 family protein [Fimbriimonas sp.]